MYIHVYSVYVYVYMQDKYHKCCPKWLFLLHDFSLEEWQTSDETGRSKVCGNGQPTEIEVQVLCRTGYGGYIYMGGSYNGVPQNGWFIREKLIKMDDLGGTPILGNLHIVNRCE